MISRKASDAPFEGSCLGRAQVLKGQSYNEDNAPLALFQTASDGGEGTKSPGEWRCTPEPGAPSTHDLPVIPASTPGQEKRGFPSPSSLHWLPVHVLPGCLA